MRAADYSFFVMSLLVALPAEPGPPEVRYPGQGRRGEKPLPATSGIPVATLTLVQPGVEQAAGSAPFQPVKAGNRVRTGDRVRTGPEGLARIEFPWMTLTAGPGTTVAIPESVVLYTVLEEGRVELLAEGNEIVKLRTPEVEIRGQGRLVVRRERGRTLVMAMAFGGGFRVQAGGGTVVLDEGEGTVVHPKASPGPPVRLLRPPEGLVPGADPVYVRLGSDLRLDWKPVVASHYMEVFPLGANQAVLGRDLGHPPAMLKIPWLGMYRVHVSARDVDGLEGMPAEGIVAVVDR